MDYPSLIQFPLYAQFPKLGFPCLLISMIKRIYATLFSGSSRQTQIWFVASLMITLCYSMFAMRKAWTGVYLVQDDTRQHLFWMQRFLDPGLFPHDLIADYFQAVAPWGFATFYRLFAMVGVDPLWLSKILPVVLGAVATGYGFGVCLQLLPIPFAGFIAALLLNQVFWSHDDLASATPRAFMPLLFLAFLYYLMRWALLPCLATIVLEGLFYPQYVLVFAGILCLQSLQTLQWQGGRLKLVSRDQYWFCLAGLGTAFLVMLPYALLASPYGPVITALEAKYLPDFYPQGRARFFLPDTWMFWMSGNRSGIFPTFRPPLMGVGILLPLLLRLPRHFSLVRQVTTNVRVLPQIGIVALGLFVAAHALLFKLHLPSRYTAYTLRFVLVFAAALCLTLLLEAGLRWLYQSASSAQQVLVWSVSACFGITVLLYPTYANGFPNIGYERGKAAALYEFLQQQPKDILVASLLEEASNLPTFAQRSVLVAPEYAVPYHVGYASQFRQRAVDLIQAQYTRDVRQLRQFIQAYKVDFWLIDQTSFNAAALEKKWIRQYPEALASAQNTLQQGKPILQRRSSQCTVLQDRNWQLLQADCLAK